MFCQRCGGQIPDNAVVCMYCRMPVAKPVVYNQPMYNQPMYNPVIVPKSRVGYILLGLFLGGLGVHNFYAGYTGRAIAQLLITLLAGWLVLPLLGVFIWIIVEVCTVSADAQGVPFI